MQEYTPLQQSSKVSINLIELAIRKKETNLAETLEVYDIESTAFG